MGQDKLSSIDYLLQKDIFNRYINSFGKHKWVTVHCTDDNESQRLGVHCALMSGVAAKRAISDFSWDLMIDEGRPGFSRSNRNGKTIVKYNRYGVKHGIRPFVINRFFNGAFKEYYEFDEEFRLYHNLACNEGAGALLAFDSSGREIEAARMQSSVMEVQLKYIRQFQAATRLHLALFFDVVRYSIIQIESVEPSFIEKYEIGRTHCWRFGIMKDDFNPEFNTFSRLLGKVIVPPPPREQPGVWPFEEEKPEPDVEYIISIDQNGNSIQFTSNPDSLSNFFGANPGAPNYLTPVFFRREVLHKYYSEPERYKVSDGHLSCLNLWGMQIDNNIRNHVSAYLGDLGRDLPYDERIHWKQFNIPPEGKISKTNYERSFLAKFSEPVAPDLVFKDLYGKISAAWLTKYGWNLFLPPTRGDVHLLDTVRIPVTNSQPELDEQILHMTKLLIDSLNEKELEKRSPATENERKGIAKFNDYLVATGFPDAEGVISFFRKLQTLRSTGSGHRKGSSYETIIQKMGLSMSDRREIVTVIMKEALTCIQSLYLFYCRSNARG